MARGAGANVVERAEPRRRHRLATLNGVPVICDSEEDARELAALEYELNAIATELAQR
jgi:hypothetical protein